jgi:hypothetical protein
VERLAESAKIAVGGFVCRVVSHYSTWDGFAIAAEDTHGIHGTGFVVLEGVSGLSKTEFARALLGRDQTLELSCAGIQSVSLNCFSLPHTQVHILG